MGKGIRNIVVAVFFVNCISLPDLAAQDTLSGFTTQPSLFYYYESGTANRLSLQDVTAYTFPNQLVLGLGVRIHLNENAGLGVVSAALRNIPGPWKWITFQAEISHLEYSDYLTGENQAVVTIDFLPLTHFYIHAGLAYRSPDFENRKVHSPFDWHHEVDELYPVFSLTWNIIQQDQYEILFHTGNYYFMNLRTSDHWMFSMEGNYRISSKVRVYCNITTAIKGVSGFVFSVNEIQTNAGVDIQW